MREGYIERRPHTVEIAEAQPEDVEGMHEVFRAAWMETYPNEELGITKEQIAERFDASNTEEEMVRRKARIKFSPVGQHTLVARVDGRIVGVARSMGLKGLPISGRNRLEAFYVHPDFHKQGIGKKLWEASKQHFIDTQETDVFVASYNHNAIGVYESFGFKDSGGDDILDERIQVGGVIIPQRHMVRPADIPPHDRD